VRRLLRRPPLRRRPPRPLRVSSVLRWASPPPPPSPPRRPPRRRWRRRPIRRCCHFHRRLGGCVRSDAVPRWQPFPPTTLRMRSHVSQLEEARSGDPTMVPTRRAREASLSQYDENCWSYVTNFIAGFIQSCFHFWLPSLQLQRFGM
jgi:hypothetical protein